MMIVRGLLRRALPLLLLVAAAVAPARAQDAPALRALAASDTIYEVRLQDGSVLYGRVVSAEGQRVVLMTEAGVRIDLDRAQIRAASPVRGAVRPDGSVWLEDPNSTRLFFGPTGRSLRGGQGYIGAFELFLPFLSYGLTDRLTISGGTPIIPEIIGRVIYLAPKVQVVTTDRVQLSTGVLAFFDLTDDEFDEDDNVLGIFYGSGTWGSVDNAVSFGAGWGFTGSDVENRPAFMLGGETRLSRRMKLITENYLISYGERQYEFSNGPDPVFTEETRHLALFGVGLRIFGERLAGDLGLGFGAGDAEFTCCIPLVNFVYNFGSSR